MRIQSRTAQPARRQKKKQPSPETVLRIEWLHHLVETYGAEAVAEWEEPPETFEEWRRARELKAFEAA